MILGRRKTSNVWRNRTSHQHQADSRIDDIFSFEDLKTATKRISIMSRAERKSVNILRSNNRSISQQKPKQTKATRPQTSKTAQINSINAAHQIYAN